MGCWNGTCMISQLPIFSGDEVALIFIKRVNKNLIALDSCYSNEYFLPYPCIVYGNYDDYGAIENVIGDVDIMYNIIEKELNITENDVRNLCNKCYGGYDKREKANAYLRYVQDSDRPKFGSNNSFGFVLIHKKLFEDLVKLDTNDNYFVDRDELIDSYTQQYTSNIDNFPRYLESYHANTTIVNMKLKNVNRESISKIVAINSALFDLRKLWFPQTGAGSQQDLTNYQRSLNKFYSSFIEEYDKKWNEEW